MIPETAEHAIDARDLTRRFGSFVAVDHITFDVRAGEVFGFLGANGAGKTTAIKMLSASWPPAMGRRRRRIRQPYQRDQTGEASAT